MSVGSLLNSGVVLRPLYALGNVTLRTVDGTRLDSTCRRSSIPAPSLVSDSLRRLIFSSSLSLSSPVSQSPLVRSYFCSDLVSFCDCDCIYPPALFTSSEASRICSSSHTILHHSSFTVHFVQYFIAFIASIQLNNSTYHSRIISPPRVSGSTIASLTFSNGLIID